MIFLPAAVVPTCTLLLALPWAGGNIWTDCNDQEPMPWTPSTSAEIYNMALHVAYPYHTTIMIFNSSLTAAETDSSHDLFAAFLRMQIIVVPTVCGVPTNVINDWRISPYTYAPAVLLHRPPALSVNVNRNVYLIGLIVPVIMFAYTVCRHLKSA